MAKVHATVTFDVELEIAEGENPSDVISDLTISLWDWKDQERKSTLADCSIRTYNY